MSTDKQAETFWDKYSNWIVLSVFLFVAGTMVALWFHTILISEWMIPEFARLPNAESVPSTTAAFGDSYGAMNALFSGLAMVAAITAIAIQTFEFRHQRKELSITNDTHKERLAFDETVHLYERSRHFAKLVSEFQHQEVRRGVELLSEWQFRNDDIKLAEVARYRFDDAKWQKDSGSHTTSDLAGGLVEDNLAVRVREAARLDRLMHYLNDLALFNPTVEELTTWRPFLDRFCGDVEEYSVGAKLNAVGAPSIWPDAVISLCRRYFQLKCDKKI